MKRNIDREVGSGGAGPVSRWGWGLLFAEEPELELLRRASSSDWVAWGTGGPPQADAQTLV